VGSAEERARVAGPRSAHVASATVDTGHAGQIPARHPRHGDRQPTPLLVFFSRGGWNDRRLDTHDALCRLTCRDADVHVLSIDLPAWPGAPAPAAGRRCLMRRFGGRTNPATSGAIPRKVAVGGDSAGGNLAAVVSQLRATTGHPGPYGPLPVLQWLIYPRTDFTAKTRSLSLFAEGFLLTKADMDWFEAEYLGGSGIERPIRGFRRCWPTHSRGCRPR